MDVIPRVIRGRPVFDSPSLSEAYFWLGCKSSLLWRIFSNAILASDSEPYIFVSGEAGHEKEMLARYRSPRKDRQIAGCEWIKSLIALEKIG